MSEWLLFNANWEIFQLYHGDQFWWWKKPEYPKRTTDHVQITGKLYHFRLWVECTLFCKLQSRVCHSVTGIDVRTGLGFRHINTRWSETFPLGDLIVRNLQLGLWYLYSIYRWTIYGKIYQINVGLKPRPVLTSIPATEWHSQMQF
jgi:hypothetical protein